ncbi:hypothetical protein CVU75_02600 [Candidatus Dependentiae bacterium HGW-Dependentiae-1]|nr:MAG: hypothetical protein CVU75_02600 [Candidatus Dependentiae bacterium HGW-Dependentiae-1]
MTCNNCLLITLLAGILTTTPLHAMGIEKNGGNARKRTAPLHEIAKESTETPKTNDAVVDALCNLVCSLELSARTPLSPQENKRHPHAQKTVVTDAVMESLCTVIAKITVSENNSEEMDTESRTNKTRTTAMDTTVVDALNSVFTSLTITADEPDQIYTAKTATSQTATETIAPQDHMAVLAAQLRQRLLQQKDRTQARARHEQQMAHAAVVESLCDLVEKIQLVDRMHELIAQTKRDNHALFDAADDGSLQELCDLLNRGINPNFVFQGTTPLIVAAGNGHLFSVNALLASGASVNRTNDKGQTALSWAASRGYTDIVAVLLAHGAQDIPDYEGKTALSCAITHGYNDSAHTLSLYWASVMQQAILNTWLAQK